MTNPPSVAIQSKKPNLWQRIRIWLSRIIPIDSFLPFGLFALIIQRDVLREINLLAPPDAPAPEAANPKLPYRTSDATGTDSENAYAGAQNTPFGRNMAPNKNMNPLRDPPVQVVASRLLTREKFQPAGMQLNVLAAAWVQFMTHDWMRGAQKEETVTLLNEIAVCPLRSFTFKKTDKTPAGTVLNERTHWWDQSVLYGQDAESISRVRSFSGGRLIEGPTRGVMPRNDDGSVRAGDNMNSWAGVQLLQELFLREHNAVADFLARENPDLRDDDENLFNIARLVVSAVAAKIHTVDWTVELLDTKALKIGMNSNWYGLPRALGLSGRGLPALFSLVGKKSENYGVPFALTEEFVAVYRLHPMLPDYLPLESGNVELADLLGEKGEGLLAEDGKAMEVWGAMLKYPCGNLTLFNYPCALRNLAPTDKNGKSGAEPVDLAALDLYRDRERGIRNYNDFRRGLHMEPFKNYDELTGGNTKMIQTLEEVYGKDGIEKVDLLVGNLAEKKIKGFAISETSFLIFLLMASRRLEADRFLNEDFNDKIYTKAGMAWVEDTTSLRDLFRRHLPELERHYADHGRDHSAFTPTTAWVQ